MPNYNDIYAKLLSRYQDDTSDAKDMVTPEDTLAAKKYNNLSNYADSLNKAMALQGSIGGKAADIGGIDLKSFGQGAMQNLALDRQAQQQALNQAKQQFDVGSQNAGNRINADQANLNMQKGQYELKDLAADRAYNPVAATNRVMALNMQKRQALASGDMQSATALQSQIENIQKADDLSKNIQIFQKMGNQKAVQQLQKALDQLPEANQLNYRGAKQAESLDEPLLKLMQTGELTPGQKENDTAFAKDWNEYSNTGKAAAEKNINYLKSAMEELENPDFNISGNIFGRLPESMRSEKSRATEQNVRAAAQGSMKATLGTQFTEAEGKRVIQAAYDPTLSPKENIKKIQAILTEVEAIKKAKEAKGQYLQQKGTLKGYQDPAANSAPNYQLIDGVPHTMDGKPYIKVNGGWQKPQ